MRFKVNVFLSSAQHEDEFKTEREALPILFKKEPLVSIFSLNKIEDQAAPMTIREQYLSLVRQSQVLILLLDSTARDAVKEEVEEARKNNIPIYPFIRQNDARNSEVIAFINYIRDFTTTSYYSSIDELVEKIEESLLNIFEVKFPQRPTTESTLNSVMKTSTTFKLFEQEVIKPELEKFIYDAIIIGAWNGESANDKAIISEYTGEHIDTWELKIKNIIDYDNSMLNFNNGYWKVNNRSNLFLKYINKYLDSDLNKLESIAIKVLKEIDPMFELEPENRYAAAVYGKIPKYSRNIKKSISEILAILAVNADKLIKCSDFKASQIVDSVIWELFENAEWKIWASLNDYLPILAEASPDQFMTSVEKSLRKPNSPFKELFNQEGVGFTGWNYMAGLLWALETLAWSEDYISRSLLILSELAELDPGGKWANRPDNSIVTILLPWFPQTLASFNKQLNSLKIIQKNLPDIAFKIILHLLPNQFGTSSGTYKPSYRNPVNSKWQPNITDIEYFEHTKEFSKIAIEMAKNERKYLFILIDYLENIPYEELDDLLKHLESDDIIHSSDYERFPIWEKINFTVNKHTKFSNSKWALNEGYISKLRTIADKIVPSNPMYLYRHLFSKNDHFYFPRDTDWENYSKEIEETRASALQKIYNYGGVDAVLQFAFSVEDKYKIGFSLRSVQDDNIRNNLIPKYLDSTDLGQKQLINGFIIGNFSRDGIVWIDNFDFTNWSKEQICSLLLNIGYNEKIWNKAQEMLNDSINLFWEKINEFPYNIGGNLVIAIDNLLKHKRPLYAAELIYLHYLRTKELLLDKAISALISGITSEEKIENIDSHCLLELIILIQNEENIDQEVLFKIEWAYLSLLDVHYGGKTVTLHKYLSTEPSFLLTILKLLYRSEKDDKDNNQITEKTQAAANNAWQLLNEWKNVPGMMENNVFSESILVDWFSSVKKICDEEGYWKIALYNIGKVFYYSPQDANGLWINKKIAELLDERDNDDMRHGYCNEVYNSRGAHIVDETGSEERKISEFWRKRSQELEDEGFVRFAASLKELAIRYEHESKKVISQFGNIEDNRGNKNEPQL